MGYAIIKGGAKEYALNRQVQNLTPKNASYRKNIASNITCTYGPSINGIYKVTDINLGDATQPYEYTLVSSSGAAKTYTGVSIHQFNGTITTTNEYNGEAVYVKIVPKTVAGYYDEAATTGAFLAIAEQVRYTIEARYGDAVGYAATAFTDQELSFFQIKVGSTVVSNKLTDISDFTITSAPSWVQTNSSNPRLISIAKNTGAQRSGTIGISCTYNGQTVTGGASVSQQANQLQTAAFKSYNGSTSVPIMVDAGTVLEAGSFVTKCNYSNGDTNVEVIPNTISNSSSSGFGSSITINSNGSIYLKVGNVVTSAISVQINVDTIIWDSDPITMSSTRVYPYSESSRDSNGNGSPDHPDTPINTYKTASSSTGKVANLYDAKSKVNNGKLIFKIVGGFTDNETNCAIIQTNNDYPTAGSTVLSTIKWIKINGTLNTQYEFTPTSTSYSHLYVMIRCNTSDQPQLLFGHE